ncbi:hypothetical protein QA601_09370 [Chitinispirillales bacterium ANBcel5]|uniref:hypothetical protein n=1 Tax=Cellulosispirillum alkaliphilum TaxID=3039283 RepID=UPI002A57022C|nr:hypothetical protein [Chitinispirillales bacterium ANBcel5]
MPNERYKDFLSFALQRSTENTHFYEIQAKLCHNTINRRFLYYLAAKSRELYVKTNLKSALHNYSDLKEYKQGELKQFNFPLFCLQTDQICSVAKKLIQKDIKLYNDLAIFEEDKQTRELLIFLSEIAKQMLRDVLETSKDFITSQHEHKEKEIVYNKLPNAKALCV